MKKIATKLRGTIPIVSFMFLLLFFVTSKTFSQVTIVTANAATGTSSTTNSLTSVPAGALLVLVTSSETELTPYCDVSSNPVLSWTRRANAEADNSGDAEIWTAVFTAGGTIDVTSDWDLSTRQAAVCYVITGCETSLGGAYAETNQQTSASLGITTTRANSLIIGCVSDWWAVDGSSRTYRDAATETQYHRVANSFTTYGFYKQTTTAGLYTEGLTAPTSPNAGMGTVLYEIRVPADTQNPSSFTLSTTGQTSSTVDLSWTAATDNVGVTGYEIYKNSSYVATTTNLTYTLTGLTCNTQYSIYVKAKDAADNSTNSNTITPTTSSCPSTCLTIVDTDAATGTTETTNSLTSVPAGALLVLVTSAESDLTPECDVSSSPALTWTRQVDTEGDDSGDGEIWTAVFTAGGNITITSDWANAGSQAAVCYVITGQESILNGAEATVSGQTSSSLGITTTRDNSIIIGCISDWRAVDGSSRTYRDAVTETQYYRVPTGFTTYGFYKQTTTAGSYTEGLTTPTSPLGGMGTVLYEIRCKDVTPPTVPTTLTSPSHTATTITINMSGATDNIGVTGYNIYVNGVLYRSNTISPAVIAGRTPSTAYDIYVRASDAEGNLSPNSDTITVTTDALGSPLTIEGYGSGARGDTTNTYVHVTNLNSSGAGSFSAALFSSGTAPRTIVFDLSGTIHGNYILENMSYITIDGAGQNITFDGDNTGGDVMSLRDTSHHIIIKNLHFTNSSNDGLNVLDGSHDIAIVNCTSYDNPDGNIDIADGYNVTVQYCILGRGEDPAGDDNGWGGDMLITAYHVSAHHNLFVPATPANPDEQPGERCPLVHSYYSDSANADIRNNVIWNFGRDNGNGSGYGTGVSHGGKINAINNYYQSLNGPDNTPDSAITRSEYGNDNTLGYVYASGNVSGNAGVNPNAVSNHAILPIPGFATVTTQSACDAAQLVLAHAGPATRNAIDNSYVNQVILGGCGYGRFRNPDITRDQPKKPVEPAVVSVKGVYPNPAYTTVNVVMNAVKQENVTIMITDINGKLIKQEQVIATTGSSVILLDISGLVPGTYLLKLVCKSNCETVVSKLIKL